MNTEKNPETKNEEALRFRAIVPEMDVIDSDKAITIFMDMPGVEEQAVDLHLEKNTLTVSAKVAWNKPENTKSSFQEFGQKHFRRALTLSEEVDQDKINAQLKDGVLKIDLPKAEKAKARKVLINAH